MPKTALGWIAMTLVVAWMTGALTGLAAPKKDKQAKPTIGETREFTWNWHKDFAAAYYGPTDGVKAKALAGELAEVEEVVFAVRANGRDWHWYANFGYNIRNENHFYHGGRGGKLMVLNLRTGQTRTLLDDAEGDVRDPAVHYDGKTIAFAYRKGGTNQYHLYTIQSDGTGLTQITDSEKYDDFEPAWLPDGGIMFISSRCMRWVPCWYSQVAIMYRCEADGSDLRPISFGVENENTPWPMPDGRVLYTRWEYVNRSQVAYHGLWTVNPDGTAVQLFYDNLGTGNLYISAKPIPGTDKICTVIIPAHGRNEQRGRIAVLDPAHGPENEDAVTFVDRGYFAGKGGKGHVPSEAWRDPYPMSENCLLAASLKDLVVMDGEGDFEVIYSLPETPETKDLNVHEPRPLIGRPREPVIPHAPDPGDGMATMVVADVTEGRNMAGVEPGTVKSLAIFEELPRPASICAYSDVIGSGSNYVLHRIIGTVPVAPDGSAHFKLPAGRPVYFVAQDERGRAVQNMGSYIAAMPGELVSCVGCHEQRTQTPATQYGQKIVAALHRRPAEIEPVADVPEIIDYVRDIQPILDKHCVKCHNFEKFSGRLVLEDDLDPTYSTSYRQLRGARRSSERGRYRLAGVTGKPRAAYKNGSGNSILLDVLSKGHKGVKLSDAEIRTIIYWIDSGSGFAGTHADLGSASRDNRIKLDDEVKPVLEKRCDVCHTSRYSRGHWLEGEARRAGRRFNVERPEKSFLLLAPLAKKAGGLGICQKNERKHPENAPEPPIFTSTDDPDYQALLAYVKRIQDQYDQPRWYQEGFQPRDWLVREMKRFEALPADFDVTAQPYPGYETDRRYFNNIYRQGPGPQPQD